jgi:hypothetical protein
VPRLAVALLDERSELPEAFARRFMLLPVPIERQIACAAHELLFVGKMVFRAGDQPAQNFLHFEPWRAGMQRLLEFTGRMENRLMLVVECRNEYGVGFPPTEKTHGPLYTGMQYKKV